MQGDDMIDDVMRGSAPRPVMYYLHQMMDDDDEGFEVKDGLARIEINSH